MRAALVIAAVALLLLVAALWYLRGTPGPGPAQVPPVAVAEPEFPSEPPVAPAVTASVFPPGVHVMTSGETLSLVFEELSVAEPLGLVLTLGDPAEGHAAISARILSEGREQPLELADALEGGAPGYTLVAVDRAWLAPGRYIIEVKTNEISHFPLRRYALDVR